MNYSKQFEDEETTDTSEETVELETTSAYEFEGFTIELNEKIMLTPVQTEN